MSEIKRERRVIKHGSGEPTIPVSSDHNDNSWIATDLYDGEWYKDDDTSFIYMRSGAGIITIYNGIPVAGTFGTVNKALSPYTVGPAQNIFVKPDTGDVDAFLPPAAGLGGVEFTFILISTAGFVGNIFPDGTDTINLQPVLTMSVVGQSRTLISNNIGTWLIK